MQSFFFFEKCTKSFTSFSQNQDYYTRVHKAAQISHHHSCPKKLISQSATNLKPKDYSSYGWCSSTKNYKIVENSEKIYSSRHSQRFPLSQFLNTFIWHFFPKMIGSWLHESCVNTNLRRYISVFI